MLACWRDLYRNKTKPILKKPLEHAGFTIDAFNDPVLALSNFKPNLYDLAILDVMMPKINGFELYNKLNKMDHDIEVYFLTASSEAYREELTSVR